MFKFLNIWKIVLSLNVMKPTIKCYSVLPTLGAGDTFNAAVIGAQAAGLSLSLSVSLACKLAGIKVGFRGFSPLKGEARRIMGEALQKYR